MGQNNRKQHGSVGRPDTSVDKHPLPQQPKFRVCLVLHRAADSYIPQRVQSEHGWAGNSCTVNLENGALLGLEFLQWVPLLKPLSAFLSSHIHTVLQDHRACPDPSSPPAPTVCFELFEPKIFIRNGIPWSGGGVCVWGEEDSSVKCLLCQHKR